MDIMFKRSPAYAHKGRNGFMTPSGVNVQSVGSEVLIHPINSKGFSDAARIAVPSEDVEDFISALRKAVQACNYKDV